MASTDLDVASEVSKSGNFSYVGGAANFTNLQLPHDDLTTRMESTDATGDSRFTLDDLPSIAGSIISITAGHRSHQSGASPSTVRNKLTDSGGTQNGTSRAEVPAWTSYSDAYPTAFGSTPWTVVLVNGLDIHYQKTVGGANTPDRVTSLWVAAIWKPKVGGFAYMVAHWATFAVGTGLFGAASLSFYSREDWAKIFRQVLGKRAYPTKDEVHALVNAMTVRPVYC